MSRLKFQVVMSFKGIRRVHLLLLYENFETFGPIRKERRSYRATNSIFKLNLRTFPGVPGLVFTKIFVIKYHGNHLNSKDFSRNSRTIFQHFQLKQKKTGKSFRKNIVEISYRTIPVSFRFQFIISFAFQDLLGKPTDNLSLQVVFHSQ